MTNLTAVIALTVFTGVFTRPLATTPTSASSVCIWPGASRLVTRTSSIILLQVPLPLAPRTTLLQVSINGIPELNVLLLQILIQIVRRFNPLPDELIMVRQ
jgi:hypothetical protein